MKVFLFKSVYCFCLILAVLGISSASEIPKQINYQGTLTDDSGAIVQDGMYSMIFKLFDSAVAGSLLWSESDVVEVTNGIFSILLGNNEEIDILFNQQIWLETTIEGESMPRIKLASVPYAYRSETADNALMLDGLLSSDFLQITDDYGRPGVASNLYEGNTALSSKYLLASSKAVDSDKLDNFDSSDFAFTNHTHSNFPGSINVEGSITATSTITGKRFRAPEAEDHKAVDVENNSNNYATIYAENNFSSGSNAGPALIVENRGDAASPNWTAEIRCSASHGNALYVYGKIQSTYGVQVTKPNLKGEETTFNLVEALYPTTFFTGQGMLKNGSAIIALDETIDLKTYNVILTPTSDCLGIIVTNKTSDFFEVKECFSGKSTATFDWLVIAVNATSVKD